MWDDIFQRLAWICGFNMGIAVGLLLSELIGQIGRGAKITDKK